MLSQTAFDDPAYQTLIDAGMQAMLRRHAEGYAALNTAEKYVDMISSIIGLGSGDWYNWLIGHPPYWLLESVHLTRDFGAMGMFRTLEAVLYFHAKPEDYRNQWQKQEDWEDYIGERAELFEGPEDEKPLPSALRGQIEFQEYKLESDNPPMDGTLAGFGFTPASWESFKAESEKGDRPELYEAWFSGHRGKAGASTCLRLLTFSREGWLFRRKRWVALPNPWNAFQAASTAHARNEGDLVAKVSPWVRSHWREVRITDPRETIMPPE